MRTLGLIACMGSIAAVACGGGQGQGGQDLTGLAGAAGAIVGAGGATGIPAAAGAPAAAGTPGMAPAIGTTPPGAGGTVGVVGAGGTVVTPGGGTPAGGAPAGGAPAGGAPGMGGAPAGGASGSNGGAASVDPPGTVTVQTGTFQLGPGQESYKCQNFDNPFGGKDVALNRIVTDMTPGSHHLHVYNLTEGTSRTLEDCTSTDFHALVHAAGSPHAETNYPDGMATKIKGSTGLRVQLHYINTTTDVITAGATLKMTPVSDISTITEWVAELYFNRIVLSVPPGMGQTVTTTCSVPSTYGTITLVGGGTHMHSRGVKEVATTNTGIQLANVDTWNEPPPIAYNPFVTMNPGDSITWTCTYNNDTGMTLTFGDSAANNEMCIYLARYYSSNPNDTQIACQATSPQGGTARPQTY